MAGCEGCRRCKCSPRHSIALGVKDHAGRAFEWTNDKLYGEERKRKNEKRWKERPHHLLGPVIKSPIYPFYPFTLLPFCQATDRLSTDRDPPSLAVILAVFNGLEQNFSVVSTSQDALKVSVVGNLKHHSNIFQISLQYLTLLLNFDPH